MASKLMTRSLVDPCSKQNTVPIIYISIEQNTNGDDDNNTMQWMAECQQWNYCFDGSSAGLTHMNRQDKGWASYIEGKHWNKRWTKLGQNNKKHGKRRKKKILFYRPNRPILSDLGDFFFFNLPNFVKCAIF